jgi:hypothetical protein
MDVMHARCAGLDVHKETVVACVRLVIDGHVQREVRTFGTTTKDLLALGDWLRERQCTHAAMESTGVYWKPVWHVLEDSLTLVLANAMHIRNVPGRKTDVNDATWIADLLAHGLIRGSFVPPTAVQEMSVTEHQEPRKKEQPDTGTRRAAIGERRRGDQVSADGFLSRRDLLRDVASACDSRRR